MQCLLELSKWQSASVASVSIQELLCSNSASQMQVYAKKLEVSATVTCSVAYAGGLLLDELLFPPNYQLWVQDCWLPVL